MRNGSARAWTRAIGNGAHGGGNKCGDPGTCIGCARYRLIDSKCDCYGGAGRNSAALDAACAHWKCGANDCQWIPSYSGSTEPACRRSIYFVAR